MCEKKTGQILFCYLLKEFNKDISMMNIFIDDLIAYRKIEVFTE